MKFEDSRQRINVGTRDRVVDTTVVDIDLLECSHTS